MKAALWILGLLLTLDALYLGCFHVLRANYYFPERYEDAMGPTIYGLLVGLPLAGAFIALLIVRLAGRKKSKSP